VADFHALRHTFITELVRAGVAPKDAKELARHSTITLTMDRYAHVGIRDTAAAVAKLNLPTHNPTGTEPAVLRATGTDNTTVLGAATGAAAGGIRRGESGRNEEATNTGRATPKVVQPLRLAGVEGDRDRLGEYPRQELNL
jgi:hypothetical protein